MCSLCRRPIFSITFLITSYPPSSLMDFVLSLSNPLDNNNNNIHLSLLFISFIPTPNNLHSVLMALVSDLINLNLTDSTPKIIEEYIWIGGSGMDLRSKARTLSGLVDDPKKLPKWNYDGSSTGQAPGEDSEVILYPQAIFMNQ
ncbi:hypothetical protein L1987_24471 [Smallanthus sonchifolius]|uniref:Uncharacterized protein n=1 Tax=Smallanthus sonchifolius TaxID=185202 RepID=A0ACB9IMA4_9ASTR|nr:hypothetical protein L1987_24471 [Smallanthus sonchifolius]